MRFSNSAYADPRLEWRFIKCPITLHYITLHYITLHYITLHYITLHYITLHYIALHRIASHRNTSHHITLHYITLHYITLHYITLHYITLHYITLHYITLHYITLHYITLHYITLHYITLHVNRIRLFIVSRTELIATTINYFQFRRIIILDMTLNSSVVVQGMTAMLALSGRPVDEAVSGGKPPAGKGVVGLLS